jgi:hypothetical protein
MLVKFSTWRKTYSSKRSHGVMDTAWTKTTLDDLETPAFTKDQVCDWDADVGEGDFCVTMGSIIVTIHGKHALDLDSWGVGWDKNDRVLLVRVLVLWVTLGHGHVDLATWVTGTAGPPFLRTVRIIISAGAELTDPLRT